MFVKRLTFPSSLFFGSPDPSGNSEGKNRSHFFKLISALLFLIVQTANAQCTIALKDTIVFKKLSFNTDKNEYSPFFFNGKLYFTGDLPADASVSSMNKDGSNTTNIFYAAQKDSVNFEIPVVHPKLNSKLNDGPITFGKEEAIFASNLREHDKEHKSLPSRLYGTKGGVDSGEIFKVEIAVSDSMSISQPCMVHDSLLYFVGKRPHSKTGGDIYSSVKGENGWGPPVRLKYPVNSANDDCFPFAFNGKLYFSSNRAGGKGGLDFYVLNGDSVTLIPSLNSDADDYGICFEKPHQGYISSNRDGSDDIYYFYLVEKPVVTGCKPMVFNSYCYHFREHTSYNMQDSANMIYEWDFGDGVKKRGLQQSHCYPGEGKYHVTLNAIQRDDGLNFETKVDYMLEVLNEKQLYIASYDTMSVNAKITFDASYSNAANFTPLDYYWDLGEGKFYEGKIITHEFTKPGTVQVKLIVKGMSQGHYVTRGVFKNVIIVEDASQIKKTKIKIPTYQKHD